MFGNVWKWAGKTRQENLNLGDPWHQIETNLHQLFGDLLFWEEHWPDVFEQAAHLHHRAVRIHPFHDGNGRWSRMLANIWLKLQDEPVTRWPEETIGSVSEIRDSYLQSVKDADQGNMQPLIELHRRYSI